MDIVDRDKEPRVVQGVSDLRVDSTKGFPLQGSVSSNFHELAFSSLKDNDGTAYIQVHPTEEDKDNYKNVSIGDDIILHKDGKMSDSHITVLDSYNQPEYHSTLVTLEKDDEYKIIPEIRIPKHSSGRSRTGMYVEHPNAILKGTTVKTEKEDEWGDNVITLDPNFILGLHEMQGMLPEILSQQDDHQRRHGSATEMKGTCSTR